MHLKNHSVSTTCLYLSLFSLFPWNPSSIAAQGALCRDYKRNSNEDSAGNCRGIPSRKLSLDNVCLWRVSACYCNTDGDPEKRKGKDRHRKEYCSEDIEKVRSADAQPAWK